MNKNMSAEETTASEQYLLPAQSGTLWSDLYYYLLRKPEKETLIRFEIPAEREDFSKRVLQRLGMSTDEYAVLNIHKIGINVPGRYVFEELLTWDNDSEHWPNNLACIKRREGILDHIQIFLFGLEKIFSFKQFSYNGIDLPPLFVLNKIHFNLTPNTSDVDNARSLLYNCSGGYPIGIFSMYVRSSIAEHKEPETSQLFFMVAFNFFGKQNWFISHIINPVWEIIHDRATANIMNRIKQICEYKFNNIPMT
jgi:hypothetical protein